MERANKRSRILYTSISIFLSLLFIFPIYILFINSFKTQKGIYIDILGFPKGDFFTLSNYPDAWERMQYFRAFANSLLISSITTALIIIFSSITAWVLVRNKGKLSTIIYSALAMSMLVPFQCVMLPLIKQLQSFNMLNPIGLIFAYIGFGTPMAVLLFHGFIKNVPVELEEAATIDGCTNIRVFLSIVFPLLKTIIVTVAVLNVMWIWNDYLLPSLLINSNPAWQTIPLKTYLFFGQFSKRWDYGTAALIMGMIPIVIFYLFTQKYIIKGITDGAIK